jgi:hypothetical protein
MPYEIYYTSATEGLKRGAQGFCTVAATEGIPAALLQRLEALSGYRHHVAPGDPAAGTNPVTFAHWTMTLSGKTYYVLSRICDAGFDYTHRTNSLAHHIALEAGELPPAGPAWLLAQPGVMISQWDGRVGPIRRASHLPFQNASPARCDAWERLTGDAGWGGVLADVLSKGASKPACILFEPGQDILSLIAESIRLLPPEKRWQATFNTYFTSMPTSVVCAWRCCAIGTPAATAAARSAANGVIINLADPAALGKPPESPWVTVARTGVAPATRAPSRAEKARPEQVVLMSTPAILEPPLELAPPKLDELASLTRDTPRPAGRAMSPRLPAMPPEPSSAPEALNTLAKQQRRQMVLLYTAAVLAIGFGIMVLVKASKPPVIDTPVTSHPAPRPEQEVANTQPVAPTPPPVATQPAIVEQPKPTPRPEPPPIVIVPVPEIPEKVLVLGQPLERVTGGSGLHDKSQDIELAPSEAGKLRKSHALEVLFPGRRSEYPYKHGDMGGALAATPIPGPGFAVQWKDNQPGVPAADVVELALDASRRQLHVTWKSGLMLKRPDVAALTFWVLQNSHLVALNSGRPAQHRLAFPPAPLPAIDLLESNTPLQLPCDLPPDSTLTAGVGQLPAGWQAVAIPDPENKDQNVQTLMLTKHTRVSVLDAVFHITVKAGWAGIATDFAAQQKTSQASLEKFQRDLSGIDQQINKLQDDATAEIGPFNASLAELNALLAKTDAQLRDTGLTRPNITVQVNNLQQQILARKQKLEADKAPLAGKRTDFDQLCQGYHEVAEAFSNLKSCELAVILPDGTAVATLHFQHK